MPAPAAHAPAHVPADTRNRPRNRPRNRSRARGRRAAVAAALCAAVALGATACGPFSGAAPKAKPSGPFGELTGAQIVDKAIATTKAATSLRTEFDFKSTDGPMKGHLASDVRGRCSGTLTAGTTGTADVLRPAATPADKSVYLRFDEALLKEQAKGESAEVREAVLRQLKGRWVKTDSSDADAKDLLRMCDLETLLADFEQDTRGTVKGAETTVEGKKALMLTLDYQGGEKDTFYVATEGKPYLLRVVSTGGKEPGAISFSHYDQPVAAKTPPKKDVVDEKSFG
ncbi:hypothetical protein [Streptomyces sp. NPDC090025]|uniref:hypothetical protein n=1 Tax=Streptomyces sp. NPDC090025 TaxID=3365922 RepID=UPI003837EB81